MLVQNVAVGVVPALPSLKIDRSESPALPGLESGDPFKEPLELVIGHTNNQVSVAVVSILVANLWLQMALGVPGQVPNEPRDIIKELRKRSPVGFSQGGENLGLKSTRHTLNRCENPKKPYLCRIS